jgi:hypothetical protein
MTINSSFLEPLEAFPNEIFTVKGMLRDGERRLLYSLAKHDFSGKGSIVDAGAYTGASACCFGAGLADRARALRPRVYIHSYDLFRADEPYVLDALNKDFGPTAIGSSFMEHFFNQTERYKALIEIHPGSFLDQRWHSGKIELLFLDVCRSAALNAHALLEFVPHLVPGKSLLIQQDFFHEFHPYIHWSMQYLKKYFLTEVPKVDATRVYRMQRRVPRAALQKIANDEFSTTEKLSLLDELALESEETSRLVGSLRLRVFAVARDWVGLDREWEAFSRKNDVAGKSAAGLLPWPLRIAERIYHNALREHSTQ